MPNLINPLQSSFVPGRHSTDNVVIAQELIHSIRRTSKPGGFMFKLDLEKAYDKVNWQFLIHTLHLFNFPEATLNLVKTCITSTSISVLWNGEKTENFRPTRGIRQADLLSPFLVVLYLEQLSIMIMEAMEQKRWHLVFDHVIMHLPIPHLLFADDLLLFGKATPQQATQMANLLPC